MIDLEVGIIYQSDMDKDIFVIKELFKENKELKARVKVYSDPRKFWHRNDYKEIEPGVFEVLYKDALNFDDETDVIELKDYQISPLWLCVNERDR
jgi:hypothetical protein